MATSYGINHPLAVKAWHKKLFHETLKKTWISKFMGESTDSLITRLNETSKSKGDRVRIGMRVLLTGAGVQGDGALEGQEEDLTTFYDDLFIDQLRHATRSGGKMSEQRVSFSVREENMMALRDWLADRLDVSFFNQISGNTAQADTRFTGLQATIAPSTGNVFASGGHDTEASLSDTTTHALSLADIDRAVARAKSFGIYGSGSGVPIRPVNVDGNDKFVLFLHPYSVRQLRTNTATGQWLDIQKAVISGGARTNNPVFTGALGEYNNVIMHEAARCPLVPGQTLRYRSIFCGAQAAGIAFGMDSDGLSGSWNEKSFDYGNQLGVKAGLIWGLKKLQFDSKDFSTIVISSYAPPA